jgi:O-methyltransferase involved in polyketide biosynthesis
MVRRYLPKIQVLVGISRVRHQSGNYVLLTDDIVLEEQLNQMFEMSAGQTGNDFLTTFARLAYYTSTWAKLAEYVEKKVKQTESYTNKYLDMQRLFLAVQAAWYLSPLGEEWLTKGFVTDHVVTTTHNILTYFSHGAIPLQ